MKQHETISYVYDFISQLLDNKKLFDSIKRIILFGSVARGDFRKESDVDLFIDTNKKIDKTIGKEINKFEKRCEKSWHLRGIDLPIKVLVGNLNEKRWKNLKEEIISYGKIIYGKFEELPEEGKHKILIDYELKCISQKKKMSFLRKLYGYKTKKGKKEYRQKGLLEEIKGEKIGSNALLINFENLLFIKKLLKSHKIKYQLRDVLCYK